jgi:hypothetical protein
MRLMVLALSLGTGIMSLIHGAMVMRLPPEGVVSAAETSANFTWQTCALLGVSAVFALLGGVLAFNRRRFGGILLLIAAAICFFVHRDTLYYGGIYLAGGVMAFFCRRTSREEDEEEDFGDDEDAYQDEEDDEMEDYEENGEEDEFDEDSVKKSPGRAKNVRHFPAGEGDRERALRFKENKETYGLGKDSLSKLNEPVRLRSSKVCPVCGASVGIEHKFCYSCGTALHTSHLAETPAGADSGPREKRSDDERFPEAEKNIGGKRFGGKISDENDEFEDDKFDEEPNDAGPEGDFEEDSEEDSEEDFKEDFKENFKKDFKAAIKKNSVPRNAPEQVEISSPNKIFVKPAGDEDVIPKRPISIKPDDSYQMFGNYARRRKHRRRPFLRRVLGMFFLLAAVGGTAWFLLGIRTAPEKDLPAPPLPVDDLPPIASNDLAVPGEGLAGPDDILAALRINPPTRGVVTGSNVNVRPDHSTAGAVVTKLNQGDRAEVAGLWKGVSRSLSGTWYQIRLAGGDAASEREGWIFGQYFQPLDSRPTTLPQGYTALLLTAFGSDGAELASHLGQPNRQTPTALTWPGLTASLRGGEVTRLQVTSAKHVFQNGIAVGITDEMLYQNMGHPSDYRSGQLLYLESANQGVSVQMKNGKIQSITVGNI